MGLSHSPTIVTDGLVLCLDAANSRSYPKSGTTWSDLAGANNGTLTNGPTFDSTNGGSIVFDGTDDARSFSSSLHTLLSLQDFTISSWFYIPLVVDTTGLYHTLFQIGTQSGDWTTYQDIWIIGIWRSGLFPGCLYNSVEGQAHFDTTGVNSAYVGDYYKASGKWTNLVFIKQAPSTFLFINGLKTGTRNLGSISSGNYYLTMGYNTNRTCGNGTKISNFSTYNRALSADEVRRNYLATKGRYE